MLIASRNRDLGTLTPPWTMGTGSARSAVVDASWGPSPTPTAAWTTSPPNQIDTASGLAGDVAHSGPKSDDEYTDPDTQIDDPAWEVSMRS